MQGAKTFFYISLGFLALAAAFHLGARSVGAQSACQFDVGEVAADGNSSGVMGRTFLYTLDNGSSEAVPDPIPGTERVIAVAQGGGSGQQPQVVLETGEVLRWTGASWDHVANLCPTVPTKPMSWGRIKSDRR